MDLAGGPVRACVDELPSGHCAAKQATHGCGVLADMHTKCKWSCGLCGDAGARAGPFPLSSGSKWKCAAPECHRMWQAGDAMGAGHGTDCRWRVLDPRMGAASELDTGVMPRICVRRGRDIISDAVARDGYWTDCPSLSQLWTSLSPAGAIYLEVGANVGACLLPMAARRDVRHAIAFEPSPSNLPYLVRGTDSNQSCAGPTSSHEC